MADIKLEPQPNGPEDPLSWSFLRKCTTLAVLSLCAFVGQAQAQASAAAISQQACLYHRKKTDLDYAIAAAAAGLATAPILWLALSNYIGRTATMFWALIGSLVCSIWTSTMTHKGDYVAFVLSRWVAGNFGSAGTTFGAGIILERFFVHQRGRAFACYVTSIALGVNLDITISGYLPSVPWPVHYRFFIGAQGFCIALIALFLDDTTYDRENQRKRRPESRLPTTYVGRRLQLLFAGRNAIAPSSEPHKLCDSILIGIQPITIICGVFSLVSFGWVVAITASVSKILQKPIPDRGYDFTPLQSVSFGYATRLLALIGPIYGLFSTDRLYIWRCRRNAGTWKPEYRLWPALLPLLFLLPIGHGICGAALQYHLPWQALALGVFLINTSEGATTPIIATYISECFATHPSEVFVILQFYRLILGCVVPFVNRPHMPHIGQGLTFALVGTFSVVGFALLGLLDWKGEVFRRWSMARSRRVEEGEGLFDGGSATKHKNR